VLSYVGDNRDRLPVVASDDTKQRRVPFRMKNDTVTDPEVQHL
jgi:hypothetical protein